MSDDPLAIYLTDHLAGATGRSDRMCRLADHERSASDGAVVGSGPFRSAELADPGGNTVTFAQTVKGGQG